MIGVKISKAERKKYILSLYSTLNTNKGKCLMLLESSEVLYRENGGSNNLKMVGTKK